MPIDFSQETIFLYFVASAVFCPHEAFQLQLFGEDTGYLAEQGQRNAATATLPFLWAEEKSFAAKPRLNDGTC